MHPWAADDVAICRLLLEAGEDPDRNVIDYEFPALSAAAIYGKSDCAQLLVDYADINATNGYDGKENYTALHHAARQGHRDIVRILLTAGARHDDRTSDGNTPLSLAAENRHYSVVELLLPRGCNVNTVNAMLNTPIHYASCNDGFKIVRALMTAGADPNVRDKYNMTPLFNAVHCGCIDVVRFLVSQNVDLESTFIDPENVIIHLPGQYPETITPLSIAISEGSVEMVDILLEAGYDIWHEEWLVKSSPSAPFIASAAGTTRKLLRRLHAQCLSPPSLLHRCKMFFRKTYKMARLDEVLDQPGIPNSVKDLVLLRYIANDHA